MASWKKVIVSGSAISQLNNDANFISSTGEGILSSSAQIAANISGSFTSTSASIASDIAGISTSFTLAADSGTSDTFNSSETLTFSGGNGISTVVTDNNIAINGASGLVSGSGQIAALVEAASDSNTFTDADHSKLDAIEASADVTDTANVTAAGAVMDSEVTDLAGIKGVTISTLQVKPSEGAFANGDKTKLDGIEASADVTDATNVTAAGALMDSELADIAAVKALNQGVATGNSPTFVGLTLTGNLEVQGTTTTIDSTTIDLGDNILAVNGTGAALGGLHVNDANGPASGSILWDGTNNKWIAGASGSEVGLALQVGQGLLSGSAQIAAAISGSSTALSASIAADIANQSQTITLSADSGTNDTYTTGETLTFSGGNGIATVVSDNNIAINGVAGLVSGSAQVVALVEAGTDSNTFTDADHSKLNAIEASADVTDTTNVTAAGALMDSEVTDLAGIKGVTISTLQVKPSEGAFADGDKTKLDAIEASADVTDATNVTAAGALMDSELAEIATVKALTAAQISGSGNVRFEALNAATSSYATVLGSSIVSASVLSSPSQGTIRLATNGVNTDVDSGLQTADSPTFASLTLTGDLNVSGTVTNINSTDLNIEDKFILLNSGSATGNSGIIAQNSASNGEGTALFFDDTANRWSLDYAGANANTDVVAADARIAAVALANDDANYQKDGNIFVDGSGDVFIYVE
jgi:hypothetical protein